MFKKERKCSLNKACMLIFQMQKTSAIFQKFNLDKQTPPEKYLQLIES